MRRALAAVAVTVVVVALLVRYDTRPPARLNPESALRSPAPIRTPAPRRHPPGTLSGRGTLITTPFLSIQVQAWVHRGRLIDVRTLAMTTSDTHTRALNARAEPILRREALAAGGADIDVVSGATTTSESWRESLIAAIEAARGG